MLEKLLKNSFILYKTLDEKDPLFAIATDETLLELANMNKKYYIHISTLKNSIILGTPDTRIPNKKSAVNYLKENFNVAVRNIGGLGIVANEGVVNFSLVVPLSEDECSINYGYELMKKIIQNIFSKINQNIESYEISNSYCPGHFDLSINGKKFAGIAQRKLKNSLIISAYISINGNQLLRTQTMKNFYTIGLKNTINKYKYPNIDLHCMTNINEFLPNITTFDVINKIENMFTINSEDDITNYSEFYYNYKKILEKQKLLD